MSENRITIQEENELFKSALLGLLKKTLSFFKKYNISYFAADGTCLGAVRHANIIPWDDDIDLLVVSHDFFRLFDYAKELEDSGLMLMSNRNSTLAMNCVKIVDTSTTVLEQPGYPVTGVWVDIYPVFYSNDRKDLIIKKGNEYGEKLGNLLRSSLQLGFIRSIAPLARFQFKETCNRLINLFYYRNKRKRFSIEYDDFLRSLDDCNCGKWLVCYYGETTFIYDSTWFVGYEEVPFADFIIRIPINSHDYLTYIYGDYMTLPPIESRIPHSKLYVNLKESLTLPEIKKRISRGIKFDY